jgi:hypothetical protein
LDARRLYVTLIISLIFASSFLFFVPAANGAVGDIEILSYSWYISPGDSFTSVSGDLVVVGEVQNKGSSIIDYVTLEGIPYTLDGEAAASMSYSVFGANLLPGQKAPFYLDFSYLSSFSGNTSWVSSFDHVDLRVIRAETVQTTQNPGLVIAAQTSYTDNNGLFVVAGIVQNNGTQPAGRVWVVTTFYDLSGGVVATNYTGYLTNSLSSNGAVQFTASPMDNTVLLSSKIASYSLLIQSKEPEPVASASPLVSSTSSSSATPSSSSGSPTAPVDSSGSSSNLIAVVAVVVLAVVVVVFALVLRKRKKQV